MVQVGQTVLDRYINELTKNDVEWNWGSWQQEAFDKLKDCVTSEPVLAHLELDKQFELEVATSGYAVGAILLQRKADGKKYPIAYYSSTLNTAEQNYDICELEYLAIHWAMMQWWHILAGSPHKIIIHLDHIRISCIGRILKSSAGELQENVLTWWSLTLRYITFLVMF